MNKIKNEDIKLLTSKLKVQQKNNILEKNEKEKFSKQKLKGKNNSNYWDSSIIWNGYEAIKRSCLYKSKN